MPNSSALEYFQSRQAEIVNQIKDFVNIESPSGDEAGIREAVGFVEEKTRQIKSLDSFERHYRANFGEHLIANFYKSQIPNSEPQILLLGHHDTVHPRGSFAGNPTRVEGDRLYGRGSFDMKANVVLILEILKYFDEFGLTPRRPLSLLLSCDEETGSESGRELVETEARKSAFCLVCEPSARGMAKTGRKGTGWFELTAKGIPAHAGLEPEKGASAILELSRQIQRLHELNAPEIGTTVNACVVKGGTTSNVIPEFASTEIDVRFTTMAEAERIESEIKALKSFDERVALTLKGEINRPPMERTAAVAELYEKAKVIADSLDYEFGETQVGGASDGNFVGALGVPVLDGLGLAGNGAHTNDEYVLISDIPKRAALLANLILSL